MSNNSWKNYDEQSFLFFERYEKLRFSIVHRAISRFLPPKGTNCLDIGAGSGRDAFALAKRGYYVTAVEPSSGLRRLAMSHHRHPNIFWVDDALPDLKVVRESKKKYRFILLSAVWMHISPEDRPTSFKTLSSVLDEEGTIAISVRMGTAEEGQLIYPTTVNEVLIEAEKHGLMPVYISRHSKDQMGRTEVKWRQVVLKKILTN